MGEMVGRKDLSDGSVPQESPLVPNRTMQRMYAGMVESRMLEERLRTRSGKAKTPAIRSQEACRIAALVDLDPEDFTSDVPGNVTTAFLRRAELNSLIQRKLVGRKKSVAAAPASVGGLLPDATDTKERFRLAAGAALAVKRLKLARVVVVFAESQEAKPALWRETLRFAAREGLPILFVVLPGKSTDAKESKAAGLSERATAEGVPGIPVDSSDAVALFRVAQESIGRARAGGGPALMECVRFIPAGKKSAAADPIVAMGEMLLRRKVCDKAWLGEVPVAFQARLDAL